MLSCDVIIWDDNTTLFYFSWKLPSLDFLPRRHSQISALVFPGIFGKNIKLLRINCVNYFLCPMITYLANYQPHFSVSPLTYCMHPLCRGCIECIVVILPHSLSSLCRMKWITLLLGLLLVTLAVDDVSAKVKKISKGELDEIQTCPFQELRYNF